MAGLRYRADPPEARLSVLLDGVTLIFHRPSGATHVVASPVPELLAAFGNEPADACELVDRLAARYGIEADDAEAAVAARLAELEAAGLVSRA